MLEDMVIEEMTQNVDLNIVLEQYYSPLHDLWSNLADNGLIASRGDGLRMPISKIKEIFALFPNMPEATIINDTDHYSGWYGTMGHMAKILNEPETYQFLISKGLDTSILNFMTIILTGPHDLSRVGNWRWTRDLSHGWINKPSIVSTTQPRI